MPELGPRLADDVLERRLALPRKPATVVLEGAVVKLIPLDLEHDVAALHAASDGRPHRWGDRRVGPYDPDLLVWRYMPAGPFAEPAQLAGRGRRAPGEVAPVAAKASACGGWRSSKSFRPM